MFDTHAHYDDALFDGDREYLLKDLFGAKGVTNIITVGCDIATSQKAISLSESYEQIYAAVGLHPHLAADAPSDYINQLEQLLRNEKVVAIGEIGLDFYYDEPPRELQRKVFSEQMRLAEKTGDPVIIHDRDAHAECIQAALAYPDVRGVFHSYSGSVESAKILMKAGWYISVSGVVTFKNAARLPEVVSIIDEDKLLVETDCPYLTPYPFRGKRNDSGRLVYTIEKIAQIRGCSVEHIESVTSANAKRLFRIM